MTKCYIVRYPSNPTFNRDLKGLGPLTTLDSEFNLINNEERISRAVESVPLPREVFEYTLEGTDFDVRQLYIESLLPDDRGRLLISTTYYDKKENVEVVFYNHKIYGELLPVVIPNGEMPDDLHQAVNNYVGYYLKLRLSNTIDILPILIQPCNSGLVDKSIDVLSKLKDSTVDVNPYYDLLSLLTPSEIDLSDSVYELLRYNHIPDVVIRTVEDHSLNLNTNPDFYVPSILSGHVLNHISSELLLASSALWCRWVYVMFQCNQLDYAISEDDADIADPYVTFDGNTLNDIRDIFGFKGKLNLTSGKLVNARDTNHKLTVVVKSDAAYLIRKKPN